MGRPKKQRQKDGDMHDVIFARMHDKENLRYVQALMLETKQPMREIVERMVEFCRRNATFKVPARQTTVEKLLESQKRREERLKAKAAGDEPA